MNTGLRTAVGTIVLALALAGCGSGSGDESAAEVGPSATNEAPAGPATVTSVTLRRSGGKTGGTVTRTFEAGEPAPDGFAEERTQQVIDRAQAFVDSDPKVPELPANTCCDRFVFTVTIEFSDGSSSTFATVDGEKTPAGFEDLLALLS